MIDVEFSNRFKIIFSKIKDELFRKKVIIQIRKISNNPGVGKPMRNKRKGTHCSVYPKLRSERAREPYIKPFRLSYEYFQDKNLVYILDLHHKKQQ